MNQQAVAGVILAGGLSSRLGRDKASEVLLGRSLLQRVIDRLDGLVDEFVIVRGPGQQLPSIHAKVPMLICQHSGGPLASVHTGLSVMKSSRAVTVACDMPLLQPALITELLRLGANHEAVVPTNSYPEPLCAVYSQTCTSAIGVELRAGNYKMTGFYGRVDVLYVQADVWRSFDPQGLSFLNVNTEVDLARARALLEAEEG